MYQRQNEIPLFYILGERMVVVIRVFGMLRSILKKEVLVVHLVGDTVEDLINQLAVE